MKYAIRFRWQATGALNEAVGPGNRVRACWPILFSTREAAQARMDSADIFRGLRHRRKLSVTIAPVYVGEKP